MTETLRTFKVLTATQGLGAVQPAATLDQGHLRREVEPLQHFDGFTAGTKTDVLGAAVRRASHKPETVQVIATNQSKQSGDQKRGL